VDTCRVRLTFRPAGLTAIMKTEPRSLSTALRVKGIAPHRHILLYGTNKRDRDRVAAYLRKVGLSSPLRFRSQPLGR
jgi:hypothetical protein